MEYFELFIGNKHTIGMKKLGNNKSNNIWSSPVNTIVKITKSILILQLFPLLLLLTKYLSTIYNKYRCIKLHNNKNIQSNLV